MNSKVYKWCAVPQCKNTSIRTPKKVFVYVPNKKIIRHKWLKLARRNPNDVVTNSSLYFCEDHFDLPNDMENYMEYHLMGSVSQVRMKPGCMPHKFICQSDRNIRTSNTSERPYIAKKRRMMILEECKKDHEEKCIVSEESIFEGIVSRGSVQQNVEVPRIPPRVLDKSIQVHIQKTSRSKANQTEISLVDQMTSPMKPTLHSVSTSPFKIKHHGVNSNSLRPSVNYVSKIVTESEQSDSDTSYTSSVTYTESSISAKSLRMESTSDCSKMIDNDKRKEDLNASECTLKKIQKTPVLILAFL